MGYWMHLGQVHHISVDTGVLVIDHCHGNPRTYRENLPLVKF